MIKIICNGQQKTQTSPKANAPHLQAPAELSAFLFLSSPTGLNWEDLVRRSSSHDDDDDIQ